MAAERVNKHFTGPVSVVCWSLPFTKDIRASNAWRETWPSMKWPHGTRHGERENRHVRRSVEALFNGMGVLAVAPTQAPE